MSTFSTSSRFSMWLQSCGLVFVLTGLLLAWGAAAWNFVFQVLPHFSRGWVALGGSAYFILASLGLWGLHFVFRKFGSRPFLWVAFFSSFLIQLAMILSTDSQWSWTGDAKIFNSYLNRLAVHGYTSQTLEALSANYDFPVWTRRALPFYFSVRVLFGEHFVRAIQVFQAGIVALSLFLTWRIARLLFGRRVAFGTVAFQWLMPFRWMACLDLNHYIFGGFYLLCGILVFAEWTRGEPTSRRKWGLAVCASLLLPLMRLESGIDQVFLLSGVCVILLYRMMRMWSTWQSVQAGLAWVIAPLLICTLSLSAISEKLDRANIHHLSSGIIGFLARGWMPESGGEYSATYEQMDWLTPISGKQRVQASLLASQAHYNLKPLVATLLPIKVSKYFLIGYASNAEEMWNYNHQSHFAWMAKGARIVFLLGALPLMFVGGWFLLPLLRRMNALCVVLPCVLFAGSTSLLGETSPRYSFYIQPFLFIMGALAFRWTSRSRRILLRAARPWGLTAIVSLGVAVVVFAGGLWFAHPWLQKFSFRDMRYWAVSPHASSLPTPSTLQPFEIHLAPQVTAEGTTWGSLQIPPLDPPPHAILLYIFSSEVSLSTSRSVFVEVQTQGETMTNSLPARVRLEYPLEGSRGLTFWTPKSFAHPLRIGYATYEFDEKTTE